MCLTFGRPKRIVEETVYSFLNQDYPGDKELLILNDFDRQILRFSHPQVTIVNLSSRFPSLGEKRNAAAALCRHDLLAVWDDDDIYLPHRLSYSAALYDERKRFFKPTQALVSDHGAISGPHEFLFHGGSLWHRSLFHEAGGYAPMNCGEDQNLEAKFERLIGPGKDYNSVRPWEIFYLYRWGGTQSFHLSKFGRDSSSKSGNQKVMDYVIDQLQRGCIQAGEIVLEPQWTTDYSQAVTDYLGKLPATG